MGYAKKLQNITQQQKICVPILGDRLPPLIVLPKAGSCSFHW